jgi:hypothetical protein
VDRQGGVVNKRYTYTAEYLAGRYTFHSTDEEERHPVIVYRLRNVVDTVVLEGEERGQRRWLMMNDSVRERADKRKAAASFFSCLRYWVHLLPRMQLADPRMISALLVWYQSSSIGAQAPKSRPDPAQK